MKLIHEPARLIHMASTDASSKPDTFGRRAFLGGAISCAVLGGCGGKVPDTPNRNMWLPGFLLRPDQLNGSLSVSPAYVGVDALDQMARIGVKSAYPSIPSMPKDIIDQQLRLTRVLSGFLGSIFDFSDPRAASLFSDLVLIYMTDKDFWPNGLFARNIGLASNMEIASSDTDIYSNCGSEGPCVINNVLTLNNRHQFFPSTGSFADLSQEESDALFKNGDSLPEAISEEALHAFGHLIGSGPMQDLLSRISSLWSAVSITRADDSVLASAWKDGFVARAMTEEGIKDYSLRPYVQNVLSYLYGTVDPEMEAAVLSILQMLGSNSDSFIGTPGRSYYDLYASDNPGHDYLYYRQAFIDREMFAKIASFEYGLLQGYPCALRPYYPPFVRDVLLDVRFNDGFSIPLIGQNPYLGDFASVLALAQYVVPKVIEQAKA